ncbi:MULTISPECIES: DUF2326 domain-containing protein [Vibrio]|uniref:DUF2326 domain-containing protein n=1 Tax=Vibrio celticus TaxID=446372 RepID=A0A1C3JKE1_9VIBR|nr:MULTISPECIES: DUF2326 domain-containing protein [Vibrio]ROO70740.1 uncharacterized protein YydD (DUF2326 family) [Vibrio crassostreae]ROR69162.1 uncharacterized protein YydD (DUF2326 family) [Vibrio crassostreae]SBT15661.1 hypothetical protein VCE7224_04466 [Vibrio celticus]
MQIRRLIVSEGELIIRDVIFNEGLNIITNSGTNGNQIGKSTTLRIINFCLGSSGENIWLDPDNKVKNEDIFNKLVHSPVLFNLVIFVNGTTYNIVRHFEQRGKKIYRMSTINGASFNSVKAFKNEISSIFGYSCDNPSFPTIKNRFTRLNKSVANRLLDYNHTYTSNDQYKLIYSHMFGFDGHKELQAEYANKQEISSLNQRRSALLNGNSIAAYQDKLRSIDDELDQLYEAENSYDIVGAQSKAIENVRITRENIARLSMKISQLEIRINYNLSTIKDYESKVSDIDIETVKSIYDEATTLVPTVYKTFEETMNFHNSLFVKKAEFVRNQNVSLSQEISSLKRELNALLLKEKELIKGISNESHLGGFILIEKEIQAQRELRGKLSYVVEEVSSIDEDIFLLEQENINLCSFISKKLTNFEAKIGIFNESCNEITKEVFKKFSIYFGSAIDGESTINFSLVNADKTTGDGSPRAAAMAIDMAFVEYVSKSGAKLPMFTLQDYLEAADLDKLTKLFNIANKRKIQTIVSVLNDKLALLPDALIDKHSVLTLSTEDKFFGV